MQAIGFFPSLPFIDRRQRRPAQPKDAARSYLERLVSTAGVRAVVLSDNGRLVTGAGLTRRDLDWVATQGTGAPAANAPHREPAVGGGMPRTDTTVAAALSELDLFVHTIRVRERPHQLLTLGRRVRRVRDVERDLARIFAA